MCTVEFSVESRTLSVEEPEDEAPPTTLTLIVQRVGGTVGVVSVSWRVIDSNGEYTQVQHGVAMMSSRVAMMSSCVAHV